MLMAYLEEVDTLVVSTLEASALATSADLRCTEAPLTLSAPAVYGDYMALLNAARLPWAFYNTLFPSTMNQILTYVGAAAAYYNQVRAPRAASSVRRT